MRKILAASGEAGQDLGPHLKRTMDSAGEEPETSDSRVSEGASLEEAGLEELV